MSTFKKGDTYYGPLRRAISIPHLWIIISEPEPGTAKCVAVNITSFTNNQGDTSCVLNPGEHPFIRDISVINYDDAQKVDGSSLQKMEAAGFLEKREPVSSQLLMKIQQGAQMSDDLDPRLADLVRRYP
jgi:hypothetical protein